MIEEYYIALKIYLIDGLAIRLQNYAEQLNLWSMRLFWYTWEIKHPTMEVKSFEPKSKIKRKNIQKSNKRKRS